MGLRTGRKNFWNLVRNPVYCGKIVVAGYQDEELHLVTGQHEPLISEELFLKVQRVLERRKVKRGTSTNALAMMPLRGFLICPACGRMLTGSASKGRNAQYYYYHCSNRCAVRNSTDKTNAAFENLLSQLSPHKAVIILFKEIVRDVFKQQTADRQNKRLQTQAQLETMQGRLKKSRELLLTEGINTEDYQLIKSECENKIAGLQASLDRLPDMETTINRLLNWHQKQLLDLQHLYSYADLENKRKLVAKLFPANFIFDGDTIRDQYFWPDLKALFTIGHTEYKNQ